MVKSGYEANVQAVRHEISSACERVHRKEADVRLIGVTKTVDPSDIGPLLASGVTEFGENRWQQAKPKVELPEAKQATWHFIGTLQENKVKYIVKYFDMIHSIDSIDLGQVVSAHAERIGRRMDILVQVNVSGESQKHGVPPEQTYTVVESLLGLPGIHVCGLMTMAPHVEKIATTRPIFRALAELQKQIQQRLGMETFAHLSMGMSQDYPIAVEEGATFVRVGRRLMES